MTDKTKFLQKYSELFQDELDASQKQGIEFLLDKMDASDVIQRLTEYAYILATVKHETANTFQPIEEYPSTRAGRIYNVPHPITGLLYYGRGYVQLTWYELYMKFAKLLNIPLVYNPDLAKEPEVAWQILELGMTRGLFTGYKLANFFSDEKTDFVGARYIINPKDKAELVASYADKFLECLL
jgi:putative chitinase